MDNLKQTQKSYYCIDLFKFIAAIFVIAIHANPFGQHTTLGIILREIIAPMAVPFFFAASGFLWYNSYISRGRKYAKLKILSTLKLYVIWSIIYFPFVIVNWIGYHNFNAKAILIYIRNFLLEGSFMTIWFLNALWLSIALIYFLKKHLSIQSIFCLSIPFYIVSCLLSSWNELFVLLPAGKAITNWYYCLFDTTKNGLLFGFVYVSLGALIAEHNIKKVNLEISKSRLANCTFLIFLSFCILVLEWVIRRRYFPNGKGCDITFALLPLTAFNLVFSIQVNLKPKPVFYTMRIYSTLMFLTQRIPLTIFSWCDSILMKYINTSLFSKYSIVYFFAVLLCTLLISKLIIYLSKKYRGFSKLY